MTSMIEQCAGAVCRVFYGTEWDATSEFRKQICRDIACAAVAAMREPTDAVAEIMNEHASNGYVNWRDYHDAMINAALKEQP